MRSAASGLLALCCTVCVCSAGAQDWAKLNLEKSPRHGEYATIHEPSGRSLQAWVVYPESRGKAPVVVMIHEIFGLSDWAREMADEVAEAGYIVVEPDLLSGFGPATSASWRQPFSGAPSASYAQAAPELASRAGYVPVGTGCDPMPCAPGQTPLLQRTAAEQPMPGLHAGAMQMGQAGPGAPYAPATPGGTAAFPDQSAVVKAVSSLPDPQVMADLDAAADYGKRLAAANGKLFVAGFCWGGGKSFLFATHRHDLSAAFVFYGPLPATELIKNITAPVYGFYAQNDARITSTVEQTQAEMKAAGKVYEPVIYDGAGHGFMRLGEAPDANAANSAARQAAFRRFVQLLGGVR